MVFKVPNCTANPPTKHAQINIVKGLHWETPKKAGNFKNALLTRRPREARILKDILQNVTSLFTIRDEDITYPLTRNYYDNNSLRVIVRNFWGSSHLQNVQEKEDFFKELRMKFVIFSKIIISE